ncbi:MAG: 3-oxoacyl-ACP reductase [Phenylobacterium sp.]|nr:3-oxoacyl-ACP reductase [Phenylobacterium sp.]
MGVVEGKVAVVTGGSSGIGRAIAERLASEGAQVVIVGRRPDLVEEAVAAIGPQATGLAADVTKVSELERLFGQVKERFGAIDVLVSSAGSTGGGPLDSCDEAAYDALMDLNVKSVFFTVQQALPVLRPPASIVVVGSVADSITLPGGGVYSASKAALRAFVQVWASDLAPRDIRVNLLSPGITETPLLDRLQSTPESMAAFDSLIANRTPMKRRGRPQEVAAAAVFLASDQASYVTGGVLYADGGLHNW